MFSQTVTVRTSRGDTDMLGMISALDDAVQPTVGDLLYAGQRQRTRILDRTARGVDVNGVEFHPYSTNGPYYYYPGKNAKNRASAARSFANKIGLKGKKVGKEVTVRGHTAQRTGLGVKFSSYAAFKAFLGRTNVDLRGPSAPHMLQATVVRVLDIELTQDAETGVFSYDGATQKASQMSIGIYGEEAERASGHNEGTRHLPRRHFMGANEEDKQLVLGDILTRAAHRARRVLGVVR